jgi:uncharacterized protein (DUF924 family)
MYDTPATPAQVLDFWFGPRAEQIQDRWFRADPVFDATIRQRFGGTVQAALAQQLPQWSSSRTGRLALILVLDQFTRNIHRGTALAFAGDAQALPLARQMVAARNDQALPVLQRWFVYLPLMHAEDLAVQDESVRLYTALHAEDPRLASALDYARRHREVIQRFGRYPHRNAALGRTSSPEELAFIAQPGTGF